MPLRPDFALTAVASSVDVDSRWVMAHAAGIGDTSEVYYNTTTGPPPAHPLLYCAITWRMFTSGQVIELLRPTDPKELDKGVHVAEDVQYLSPIRVGIP